MHLACNTRHGAEPVFQAPVVRDRAAKCQPNSWCTHNFIRTCSRADCQPAPSRRDSGLGLAPAESSRGRHTNHLKLAHTSFMPDDQAAQIFYAKYTLLAPETSTLTTTSYWKVANDLPLTTALFASATFQSRLASCKRLQKNMRLYLKESSPTPCTSNKTLAILIPSTLKAAISEVKKKSSFITRLKIIGQHLHYHY